MPTLKEIKARIASVQSTLKITSAMKLVSSAKLRKAQNAIESMRPYERALQDMLAAVSAESLAGANLKADAPANAAAANASPKTADFGDGSASSASLSPKSAQNGDGVALSAGLSPKTGQNGDGIASSTGLSPKSAEFGDGMLSAGTVIVAMASNSSLCGGFNANVIAKVCSVRRSGDTVISVGRKMADAMRRDGFPSPEDYTALADHPAYAPAAALVERLAEDLSAGHIGRVLLVYNHFVSAAKQVPVVETLLEAQGTGADAIPAEGSFPEASLRDPVRANASGKEPSARDNAASVMPGAAPVMPDSDRASHAMAAPDIILEPGRKALLEALAPKTLKLKLFAALLDSAAAEHAARTVAMQTATDNAENLLSELTLQYNKGRQQKITAEILDLAGGQTGG